MCKHSSQISELFRNFCNLLGAILGSDDFVNLVGGADAV